MEAKNMNQTELSQEEAFREKAKDYLMCFIDSCPVHEQCLRWLVGQYAKTTPFALTSVNPRNPKVGGEQCEMFRKNVRVIMKRGLTQLYREMPTYQERLIRNTLIAWWSRKKYFEIRKGDRPITPEQQEDVIHACRHHGWKGPIIFDSEEEDWLW